MSMRRDPDLPRKPGVFLLLNNRCRAGYVAYTSDLQKRAHTIAHMLNHPKDNWAIRDLPHGSPSDFTYTAIEQTGDLVLAEKIIRLTKKSVSKRRYRIVEGNRSAMPIVTYLGRVMPLTEAMVAAGCDEKYVTTWRRLKRGWTVNQALGIEDPPARSDTNSAARKRRAAS